MTATMERLRAALTGRYAIERELGSGGMATVYLAHDLKHDRNVAVKVLKPELAAVLGPERFLAEIRTTASLQHPNILPLFDSGSADGALYYVMPFVPGETLRSKLDHETQLRVDEAVRIAGEVADALDYAHRRGVIHRDIKPENILLQDGRPLVADFGIALAVSAAAGGRLTESGLSLGTPHYMSPEQATADKELTFRSDIYSLGTVLYEMLSGSPPHVGATVQQIVRKILTDDPAPIGGLRRAVPPNVAAAVGTALEKVPADRFESAKAFADALRTPTFRATTTTTAASVRRARPWLLGAGAAVAGIGLGFGIGRGLTRPKPGPVTRFAIALPKAAELLSGAGVNLTWSPDGSRIVYVGFSSRAAGQLWQRRLDDLAVEPIAGTEGALIPAISPNGSAVAFTVSGALKTIALGGGVPITLVSEGVPSAGGGIAWGDDGRIYFIDQAGAIESVDASGRGGSTTTVAAPAAGSAGYMWVEALPGGKGLVFTIARLGAPELAEIAAVSTKGGPIHRLVKGTMGRYASSGHLVFATAEGALMAARFDPDRLTIEGSPVALFQGVDVYMGSASQFALSRAGDLAWSGSRPPLEIVRVDRQGIGGSIDPNWTGAFQSLELSPDGSRLAVTVGDASGARVWIKRLDGGPVTPLALEGSRNLGLAWSADGRALAILSRRSNGSELWLARADGTGAAERTRFQGNLFPAAWSGQGSELVVARATPGARSELAALRPTEDSVPRPLLAGSFLIQFPAVSPDGHWLAYSSNETGRDEVYVQPYPNPSQGKWQVSTGGGGEPLWAHNGREIFYRNPSTDAFTAVEVTAVPNAGFRAGPPRVLFASGIDPGADGRAYAVEADDRHFILARPIGTAESKLMVVRNFSVELAAKRAP
jgi:serine/threonine-protein kinase